MKTLKDNWKTAAASAVIIIVLAIFPALTFPTIAFVAVYLFSEAYIFAGEKLFDGYHTHKTIFFINTGSVCLLYLIPALISSQHYERLFHVFLILYFIGAVIMKNAVAGKKAK